MRARKRRPMPAPLTDSPADLPLWSGTPAEAADRPYTPARGRRVAPPELPGMPEPPAPTVDVNGYTVPTAHAGAVSLGGRRPYVIHHAIRRPLPATVTADYTRADRTFGGLASLAWLTPGQARDLGAAAGVWLVRVALAHETSPAHWREGS